MPERYCNGCGESFHQTESSDGTFCSYECKEIVELAEDEEDD
jgi:predicted nucleic acid-binding Zn ribbon protein